MTFIFCKKWVFYDHLESTKLDKDIKKDKEIFWVWDQFQIIQDGYHGGHFINMVAITIYYCHKNQIVGLYMNNYSHIIHPVFVLKKQIVILYYLLVSISMETIEIIKQSI